ncbi:MAG: hypothetical protein KFF73_03460 [Cyclobacteriaceae bacterium]|nr:hypothetical protein [Cyclobacteriaceae bacterium]
MKNLILTILTAATVSTSCAFTIDRNKGSYTAAEEDFITACTEKNKDCYSIGEKECSIPEIIIVEENGCIFAKGNRNNEIIKNFMMVADFLTDVQGTAYFQMNMQQENNGSLTFARE